MGSYNYRKEPKGTEMNRKEPELPKGLPKGTERNRKDHELPKGKGPHL